MRDTLMSADKSAALGELAIDLRMQAGANEAMILLPIDQGEELFGTSELTHTKPFLELISAISNRDLPYIVVVALRSDYLGALQAAEHLNARFEEFSL